MSEELRRGASTRWLGGGLMVLAMLTGCGGPTPVRGGTTGKLHADGAGLRDIEVTVHRQAGSTWELVGSGITDRAGEFALIQPLGAGPLWLEAGEYRCTLASVGAEPVLFPKDYRDPAKTPLQVTRQGTDTPLELNVPLPKPIR